MKGTFVSVGRATDLIRYIQIKAITSRTRICVGRKVLNGYWRIEHYEKIA